MGERLQKVLSRAGHGSRREIERQISQGKVKVNGQLATLGLRIAVGDRVELDGFRMIAIEHDSERRKVLIYNKPEGQICSSSDPDQRATVFDNLPRLQSGRWVMVGRLDVNTQGLLVFTTDGELAHKMMHPSSELEREYAVRLRGQVDDMLEQRLLEGVELDDGPAKFDTVSFSEAEGTNVWAHVTLREGRNREVRRLWESQGFQVSRLIRVRYGSLLLPRSLRRGKYEFLSPEQVAPLLEALGLSGGGELTLLDERRAASHLRHRAHSGAKAGAKRGSKRPPSRRQQQPEAQGGDVWQVNRVKPTDSDSAPRRSSSQRGQGAQGGQSAQGGKASQGGRPSSQKTGGRNKPAGPRSNPKRKPR